MEFVHLHVHSYYSKGWGIPSVEEIVLYAKKMHMDSIALTDTNGLYGLFPFLDAAKEHNIKPILGSQLEHNGKRALALIENKEGYENLSWIISSIHIMPQFDLTEALKQRSKGLIIISDQPSLLMPLKERRSDGIFFEVSLGHSPHKAYKTAKALGIPPIATTRACMIHPSEYFLHKVLRAIILNKKIDRLNPSETASPKDFLAHPSIVFRELSAFPDAIQITKKIALTLNTQWDFVPVLPHLEGISKEEAFWILLKKTLEGSIQRYGGPELSPLARALYELSVIEEKGYASYFLLVEDIAKRSGYTCGRGSAAASIVSYALGLTQVDPLSHGLMFERFLNPKRKDPPDIDIDFPWDERAQILKYVFERYGREKVALVANQNHFKIRAAVRAVARVFGLPEEEIKELIQRIEISGTQGIQSLSQEPRWEAIVKIATRLNNHFYHLSTHCGGLVIVPDSIKRYCPVEISPKGFQVLQWEKDGVEASGLVKIDILGNRSLSVIRDTLKAIIQNHGMLEEAEGLYKSLNPLTDPKTLKIFYNANTMGIFYFESPATRRVLTQVSHGLSFEEYIKKDPFKLNVIVTSIIRPASNKSIKAWIERLHGAPWEYPHPLMEPVLKETLGIMVFQEQLSQAAMYLAGFDAKEADELRKVVSKKHKEKKLRDFYERFCEGANQRGVGKNTITEIWNMMMGFDGYSFCKPHSASYTMVAYKSAYLKAHYPAEFMAAVISNRGGYYSTFAYISEAKRMGLEILKPDINKSQIQYTGFKNKIQMGFMEIKDLRKETIEVIVEERNKNGPFESLDEFIKRMKRYITWNELRLLIRSGCFNSISNGISLNEMILKSILSFQTRKKNNIFQEPPHLPHNPKHYELTKIAKIEIETFGFPVSIHPIKLYFTKPNPYFIKAKDLKFQIGKEITIIGWWISEKYIHTVHKEEMVFITFEDETGLFEVVVFPDIYKRYSQILFYTPYPYIIRGKVEEEKGAISVELRHIGIIKKVSLNHN